MLRTFTNLGFAGRWPCVRMLEDMRHARWDDVVEAFSFIITGLPGRFQQLGALSVSSGV